MISRVCLRACFEITKHFPQLQFSLLFLLHQQQSQRLFSRATIFTQTVESRLLTTNCPLLFRGFPSSFSPWAQTLQEGGRASGCSPNNKALSWSGRHPREPSRPPSPHECARAPTECLFEGRGLIPQKVRATIINPS